LQEIESGVTEGNREQTVEAEILKLQKEMGDMKVEIEGTVNSSVHHVTEDVKETLEIERRK
jgi:hypothetical protein